MKPEFKGGDKVLVDGRSAIIKAAKRKADKTSGAPRGQRTYCVEFDDGSTMHVSKSRIRRRG